MLTAGLLLALAIHAQPEPALPVELRWSAPEGCPDRAELERQVAALLAGHAAPAGAPPRVSFTVERAGDGWQLLGEIAGEASGERRLGAASCSELVEAAALITAIAVDPDFVPGAAVVPTPPPAPPIVETPAPPEPAPPVVEPVDEPPPATAPPRRRRPAALIGVSAGLGLGALPAPAGLLRLALGLGGRAWSAAVVQDFWLPREGVVAGSPEVGGRFWLWSAGVRGCGIPRAGRFAFPLCATIAAGVMTGEGTGAVTVARRQISPWVAVNAGPGLHVTLTRRIGLLVAAELLVVLARPNFEIRGRGSACCDGRVGGQMTAGIELRLP